MIETPTIEDTIAPSRVLDFKITTIAIPDSLLKILRAEFTSPGDDLDVGTGTNWLIFEHFCSKIRKKSFPRKEVFKAYLLVLIGDLNVKN